MDILEIIAKRGVEHIGRYYSIYRGFVIDPKPDSNGFGDIVVNIPSIQGGINVLARSQSHVGGIKSGAKLIMPRVGDVVLIEFEKGDPMRALWRYSGWTLAEVPEELEDSSTLGIVTPNGNKVYLKDTEGHLEIFTSDQIHIKVGDGSEVTATPSLIKFNGGENRGIMNIERIESLILALQKDLIIAKSGTNLAKWMATDMPLLEDKKITH